MGTTVNFWEWHPPPPFLGRGGGSPGCSLDWVRNLRNVDPSFCIRAAVSPQAPRPQNQGVYLCSFHITSPEPPISGKGYPRNRIPPPYLGYLLRLASTKNTPFSWFSREIFLRTSAPKYPLSRENGNVHACGPLMHSSGGPARMLIFWCEKGIVKSSLGLTVQLHVQMHHPHWQPLTPYPSASSGGSPHRTCSAPPPPSLYVTSPPCMHFIDSTVMSLYACTLSSLYELRNRSELAENTKIIQLNEQLPYRTGLVCIALHCACMSKSVNPAARVPLRALCMHAAS